jgi:hypothetical protein
VHPESWVLSKYNIGLDGNVIRDKKLYSSFALIDLASILQEKHHEKVSNRLPFRRLVLTRPPSVTLPPSEAPTRIKTLKLRSKYGTVSVDCLSVTLKG